MKCCCGRAAVLLPSGKACCLRVKMPSQNEVNALTMRCCAARAYFHDSSVLRDAGSFQ